LSNGSTNVACGHAIDPRDDHALQNIIGEIETLISTTTPLPETHARCLELLTAARALTADLESVQVASTRFRYALEIGPLPHPTLLD